MEDHPHGTPGSAPSLLFTILLLILLAAGLCALIAGVYLLSSKYGLCTTSISYAKSHDDYFTRKVSINTPEGSSGFFYCHAFTPAERVSQGFLLAVGIVSLGSLADWKRRGRYVKAEAGAIAGIAAGGLVLQAVFHLLSTGSLLIFLSCLAVSLVLWFRKEPAVAGPP
jgi:hypothetical protein